MNKIDTLHIIIEPDGSARADPNFQDRIWLTRKAQT
jgi:hypothetical protein